MADERIFKAVSAAEIEPAGTRWLWKQYVPLGSHTVLAGRQGLGKSTAALRICSYVTKGKLPGDLKGKPRAVIYATAEDQLAATLVPRLQAAGADLSKVYFPEVSEEGTPSAIRLPDDIPALATLAERLNVGLLVIDPIVAFLSGRRLDAHRDQDVRVALAPLAAAAEKRGFALLSIMHLNKSTATSDALSRISGSVAFTAAPRSVLIFGSEPSDPDGHEDERVLAQAKSNLGKLAPSRSCWIESKSVLIGEEQTFQPVMHIGRTNHHGATDVVAAVGADDDERSARAEAKHFLQTELTNGPVKATVLLKRSRDLSISKRTLDRAKGDLGVVVTQHREAGEQFWLWALPGEEG